MGNNYVKFIYHLCQKSQFSTPPFFLFPWQRQPCLTNRSRFYCINQLHLMQGVILSSFMKICWAGNEIYEFEVFHSCSVSMATAAILKFFPWHCTSNPAEKHSCEVSYTWVQLSLRKLVDNMRYGRGKKKKKNNNNKKRSKNNKSPTNYVWVT